MYVYICFDADYSKYKTIRELKYDGALNELLTIDRNGFYSALKAEIAALPIHIFLMSPVFCNDCTWFGFDVDLDPSVIDGDIFPGVRDRLFFEAYDLDVVSTVVDALKKYILLSLIRLRLGHDEVFGVQNRVFLVPYEGHWEALDAFARRFKAFE